MLQLVSGLTEAYNGVGTLIRQSNPLPAFYQARSMLILEESGLAKKAATGAAAAMIANSQRVVDESSSSFTTLNSSSRQNNGKKDNHQNNGGKNRGGRGGRGNSGGCGNYQQQQQQWSPPPWQQQQPPSWFSSWPRNQQGAWPWMPWVVPPCPYPTAPWSSPSPQPGVLGPRPPQAHVAADVVSSTPTNIEAAMHTLSLNPPDANWYMDTGATSHMMSNGGILSSYSNVSNNCGIIVGNGHSVPICGYGHTNLSAPHPPLVLKNVLHAPHLIKNLMYVCKFTTDNNVSVEFDPFGFSVKDFRTGQIFMRCRSRGDLYPISKILD